MAGRDCIGGHNHLLVEPNLRHSTSHPGVLSLLSLSPQIFTAETDYLQAKT